MANQDLVRVGLVGVSLFTLGAAVATVYNGLGTKKSPAVRVISVPRQTISKDEVVQLRNDHLCKGLRPSYDNPIMMVKGRGQYMWDEQGNEYLDAYNNVPHAGHCHPHIIQAATAQLSEFNANTRYLHPLIGQLAKRLTQTMPSPLSVVFFVNSGSEANDLALRLARVYTKRRNVIVLNEAYHGTTMACVEISPQKHYGHGAFLNLEYIHKVAVPDAYKGKYTREDPQAAEKYAAEVKDAIAKMPDGVSAYIAESIQGVGGQVIYVDHYLERVFEVVRAAGGVCISDEVQTGFGRVGTHYWAFQQQNVVPDIVTIGKPFGNGYPLGAVVTTPAISEAFSGMEYFNTFGGSPAAMAVGLALMDVVENEQLQRNALEVGNHMIAGLKDLQKRFPIIGDVRGSGLFVGVELVKDRATRTPDSTAAKKIINTLREDFRILISYDGPGQNVLRIKPPMCFSKANADSLVKALAYILASMASSPSA